MADNSLLILDVISFLQMSDVHYVLVIKTITDVLRVKEISVVSGK